MSYLKSLIERHGWINGIEGKNIVLRNNNLIQKSMNLEEIDFDKWIDAFKCNRIEVTELRMFNLDSVVSISNSMESNAWNRTHEFGPMKSNPWKRTHEFEPMKSDPWNRSHEN